MEKLLKLPATKGLEGKILLRELYEQCYGIADHISSENPMEIVLRQSREELDKHTQEQDLVDQYAALDIYGTFGISFVEFKKLPISESTMLMKSANTRRERESKRAQELEQESKRITE